ncbi:MAG TPA: hypothetical protein VGB04_05540 [Allosphingosinicella sp.]|jgi:hypothetical protein
MPSTIFDWIVRTAMLAMAGLVTLSILGAIATMTNDAGTGFAGGDRPLVEAEPAQEEERKAAQPPAEPDDGNLAAAAPAQRQGVSVVAAPPAAEDRVARWLEAIAYALLAIAGIGALGVLMLWSAVRELRRIGRSLARWREPPDVRGTVGSAP